MSTFQVISQNISFDRQRFHEDINLFTKSQTPQLAQDPKAPETSDLRGEFAIQVDGEDVPSCLESFQSIFDNFRFDKQIQQNVINMYKNLTPIQMQAIPALLNNRDVIGIAPTGTGKTLAFLLPLLRIIQRSVRNREKHQESRKSVRLNGLIIAPTKELAKQITQDLVILAEKTAIVVENLSKKSLKLRKLKRMVDIIVSTPMIFINKLGSGKLKQIKCLVLDEVDQLFDMGYIDQVDTILQRTQRKKQIKAMFSATLMPNIEILARSMLINPVRILVGVKNAAVDSLIQELKFCTNEQGKLLAIRQLLNEGQLAPPVLIFVQSKHRANELFHELLQLDIKVAVIHSDLQDRERQIIIKHYRTGKIWVLICTDLMSRGIDFVGVNLVINYDFPQSIVSYIHRIGRAGRVGRQARALTLYTLDDQKYVKMIANVIKRSGQEVPEWMTKLKGPSQSEKKEMRTKPIKRENVGGNKQLSRGLRRYLAKKQNKDS